MASLTDKVLSSIQIDRAYLLALADGQPWAVTLRELEEAQLRREELARLQQATPSAEGEPAPQELSLEGRRRVKGLADVYRPGEDWTQARIALVTAHAGYRSSAIENAWPDVAKNGNDHVAIVFGKSEDPVRWRVEPDGTVRLIYAVRAGDCLLATISPAGDVTYGTTLVHFTRANVDALLVFVGAIVGLELEAPRELLDKIPREPLWVTPLVLPDGSRVWRVAAQNSSRYAEAVPPLPGESVEEHEWRAWKIAHKKGVQVPTPRRTPVTAHS